MLDRTRSVCAEMTLVIQHSQVARLIWPSEFEFKQCMHGQGPAGICRAAA